MARRGDGLILRNRTWWLDFRDSGIRHQVRLGKGVSRTVARELAAIKRSAILRGEAGIGGKKRKDISFEKAAEEFLKWAEANKRPNTVKSYKASIKQLLKSFQGNLSDVHPFLIEKHKQRRLAEGVRVSLNRELTCLKGIFNKAIDWSRFEGISPARKIKKIDEPLNRIRFLTNEEERTLLAVSQEPLRTIILVGIYAGLRIQAEALTLKWENVDLERKLLTVEAAYAKNGETETIPMNSRLVGALKELQKTGEFVFTKRDGTPYRSVTNAFETACRRAKLRDVTPHTLRHTFASRLGMSGANDRTIQALGRWKEPKMIQRYAHLSKEHLADAVERIVSHSTTLFTTPKAASSQSG